MNQKWIGRGTLALSVALHAYLIYAAPRAQKEPERELPPVLMELAALPPEPSEPAAEPLPEPEVLPEPEPEPTEAEPTEPEPTEPEPTEPEPSSEPEPATEPAPPELTGNTLVAEGEGDFSAEVGSGRSRTGAIRAGVSRPTPQKAVKSSKPKAAPPRAPEPKAAIPLASLSKKPVPPDLGGALKQNYPPDARRQGRAGEAKVQARVEPSGSIGFAKVSFESEDGFGAACRKTLLASKWTAPLDRTGNPVATWVSYRCKFRID
jgi:outer membrane biosynthesis protein TonB